MSLVKKAQKLGYNVTLLYFWLSSPEFAIQRVAQRVEEGGNLMNLYLPICNNWIVVDNGEMAPQIIAKSGAFEKVILNNDIWKTILIQSEHYGK